MKNQEIGIELGITFHTGSGSTPYGSIR